MREITLFDIENLEDIYDPQVQETLARYLKEPDPGEPAGGFPAGGFPDRRAAAIGTAIKIHSHRRRFQVGLANRIKLESASREEWKDPREADGVPIFARRPITSTKVNHRLHTPFDRTIIESKASYFVGVPPVFSVPDDPVRSDEIFGWMIRSGFMFKLTELAQAASGRGQAFVLLSSPPGEKELYVSLPDEWSSMVIYDTVTEEPLYGIRYWYLPTGAGMEITAELYDEAEKTVYTGTPEGLVLSAKPVRHELVGVPLIEFANSSERLGDVELTTSLQDAFDIVDSDLSSEISQLRLAYLAVIGEGESAIDEDWLNALTKTGVFTLGEGDAKFIEKNLNSAAIEELKRDLEARIYKYSNSYNPDELGSDGTMTAYQIRRKLFRLESSTAESEAMFRRSIYHVLSIVSDFYSLNFDPGEVDITFTRNTPRNVVQDIVDMTRAGFILSQKRLAALSPLDVNQETNASELAEESGPVIVGDAGEGPLGDVAQARLEQATEVAKLSGIQIQSANAILQRVADGVLGRQAGIDQLEIFLGLTFEQASRIMGEASAVEERITTRQDEREG